MCVETETLVENSRVAACRVAGALALAQESRRLSPTALRLQIARLRACADQLEEVVVKLVESVQS
jgi:hypothetical protein